MERVFLLPILFLAGCVATPLMPGSGNVRLTNTDPGNECRYLAEVTGSQGGWLKGAFTTNANLEQGARNELKNNAAAIGGNVVQVIVTHSGNSATDYGSHTTLVTYVGAAFDCPQTVNLADLNGQV